MLRLPAKILLFGEYGLMYGGSGVVLTTSSYQFEIACTLNLNRKCSEDVVARVWSSFFESGSCIVKAGEGKLVDSESGFFAKLLQPWYPEIADKYLEIHVTKSFLPRFGFGSSSALIAGINLSLWKTLHGEIDQKYWVRLRDSLHVVQNGKGSGYDVAVQTLASIQNKNILWSVHWPANAKVPDVNVIENSNQELSGVIVDSGEYSDTSAALQNTQWNNAQYASQYAKIADDFLQNRATLKKAVRDSFLLASQQGIVTGVWSEFLSSLANEGIDGKTLGAGAGDAFWLLLDRNEIKKRNLKHPLSGKNLDEHILLEL